MSPRKLDLWPTRHARYQRDASERLRLDMEANTATDIARKAMPEESKYRTSFLLGCIKSHALDEAKARAKAKRYRTSLEAIAKQAESESTIQEMAFSALGWELERENACLNCGGSGGEEGPLACPVCKSSGERREAL